MDTENRGFCLESGPDIMRKTLSNGQAGGEGNFKALSRAVIGNGTCIMAAGS